MFSGLTTLSRTVAALFAPPFLFSVPSYQRSYSWTLREAAQLLEDVAAAAGIDGGEAEPDYFLGAILLLANEAENPPGSASCLYDIIDGQQRLATLTILACVLREMGDREIGGLVTVGASEGRADRTFRLQLRGNDQSFMQRFVQMAGSAALSPAIEPASPCEAAILEVRDLFLKELANYEPEARARLARFIAERCHVVVIQTHDIDRAHRLFSVLNERGKPLRRNDILKAEILHGMPADESTRALELWDRNEIRLGKHFEDLFSHIRVIHGKTRPQVIAAVRSIIADVGGPSAFVFNQFGPYAEAYARLLGFAGTDDGLDPSVSRALKYLNRLAGADWVPPTLLAMKLYGDQPGALRYLIGEIDRLAHLLRIHGLGTGKRNRRFEPVVAALHDGSALEPESGVFDLSRDEVRTTLYNLRSIHKRNQSLCKLLLLRLSDEIAGVYTAVDPSQWSVEHVLPCRPAPLGQWRQWFPDPNERETCTDSLGNLVLVTPRQNDRARNEEFKRKQAIYRDPEQDAPVLPITRPVLDSMTWLPLTFGRARRDWWPPSCTYGGSRRLRL